ncbi:MAG: MG2 domain-containing protein, partial [Planctomycetota bacterium]
METPAASSRKKPAVRPAAAPTPWARGADWTVGVSAGVLLLISLSGWLYHRAQLADLAADHLRLQVTGPARLRPAMANEYSIMTTSVTGRPVSAQIEFALHAPDDEPLWVYNEKTDESGRLTVTIPADAGVSSGARLKVSATHEKRHERVVARLSVEPVRYATCLSLNKPLYQPGETVRYRSLTLSRFALEPAGAMPLSFEILDPGQTPVPGSPCEAVTRRGVASGQFQIPEGLAGGEYTLVARSLKGQFPTARQKLLVGRYRLPRLKGRLEFARNGFGPGDTVVADFSVERAEGGAAAGAGLKILATVDGQLVHQETAQASPLGTYHVEFALPGQIERADAQLLVVADDGGLPETIAKTIPILLELAEVSFYPEGGSLVAGLENWVYFAARNSLGEPVDIRGTVVNGQGQRVATAESTHEGMGRFGIVPLPGEEYRFVVAGAAGAQVAAKLPAASTSRRVTLSMGLGVFSEEKPLEFSVRVSKAGLPLVASAWCRGLPVGRQVFIPTEEEKAHPVVVPLDDEANGVIRLVIYDYSSNPPEPVAERLVYRRPTRRLEVEIDGPTRRYSPGDQIEMPLSVTDEAGNPAAATLGVRVLNGALWNLAGDDTPDIPAHFRLATEVEHPQDLERADFYLSQSREAAVALDLLLGTQGWRRFLENKLQESDEKGRHDEPIRRLAAMDGSAHPPLMFDNLIELHERYRESLAAYRAGRTKASNALTTLSFLGGGGLVMLVAMLQVLNIAGGARLWAPAIVVATACLIIGGILMDPGRWSTPPEGAVVFVPFDPGADGLSTPVEASENLKPAEEPEGEPEKTEDDALGGSSGIFRSDAQGRAQVRFDSSGPAAEFRVLIDAHANGGRIGSGQGQRATGLPFQLEPRLPLEVSPADRIDVPLAVVNDTDAKLAVELALEHGEGVRLEGEAQRTFSVEAKQSARQFFSLDVLSQSGDCRLTFRGAAGQLADEATGSLKVVPPGFPAGLTENGQTEKNACPVRLSTRLSVESVPWGETVALEAEVLNTTDNIQPMTVARLGLPAGLEPRHDQLQRL